MSAAPAQVDLTAYRGTPFVDVTSFEGFDYTGATFAMQLRKFADKPDPPLVSLTTQANPAAEGVSVLVSSSGGVTTSDVQIRINETTLEGLEFTSPRGGDLALVYALDITGGGHGKLRRMRGTFTLVAGENG